MILYDLELEAWNQEFSNSSRVGIVLSKFKQIIFHGASGMKGKSVGLELYM